MLKLCWQRGLTVFLYFGELNATRDDGAPLAQADRIFIRMNKTEIIEEIKKPGIRIDAEKFYGPALMADAANRRKQK